MKLFLREPHSFLKYNHTYSMSMAPYLLSIPRIRLEQYPSASKFFGLMSSLDVLVECTFALQDAPLFNWLMWLRGKPSTKHILGSPQSIFWLFPAPPHHTFTYVWCHTKLSKQSKRDLLHSAASYFQTIALVECDQPSELLVSQCINEDLFSQAQFSCLSLPFLTPQRSHLCKS